MILEQQKSLKSYNTFGIDVSAKNFISVRSIEELGNVLKEHCKEDIFILSGGSNILLTKDIDALVVHIDIKGIDLIEESEKHVVLKIGAGENWHNTVLYCIDKDYGGIENLSLIPGKCGTAPIQNIGAYGVELKDVFVSCEAININTQDLKTFSKEECKFGYRDSIFKNELKGHYVITSISLKLTKPGYHNLKTDYGAIKSELESNKITSPDIKDISKAVIAIRSKKLPDPEKIGNSGSFFKNPVINIDAFARLQKHFPDIPSYKVSDKEVKVPAGWLIEKAGFKGKSFGDYGVHKDQALVLVNFGNANGHDILQLSKLIKDTVKRLFSITIETEVNII